MNEEMGSSQKYTHYMYTHAQTKGGSAFDLMQSLYTL